MKKTILIITAIFLIAGNSLLSQEDTSVRKIRIGMFGAVAINMHSGQFSSYDGLQICGTFEDGTGIGWMAGNSIEIPINSNLSLFGRAFFHKADGDFESIPKNTPRISLEDGTLVDLSTKHKLDVSLDYIQIEALGAYYVSDKVYLALGPGVALPTHASYVQVEEIQEPFGLTFRNGESTRQIASANFDEAPNTETNLRIAVHALIGADFSIANNLFLSPEAGYIFPFTNVLSNNEWSVSTLHAGLALKYELGSLNKVVVKEVIPESEPETKPKITPKPIASLKAKGLLENGTMLEFGQITVSEENSNNYIPILPYIFFDAGNSKLPNRYRKLSESERDNFDESTLQDSVILVYHNLLNIVGSRMQKNTSANLTVTGCVEPADDGVNLSELASSRAKEVKDYLVDRWGISADRIITKTRELPEEISNRTVAEGREENRRVEIFSSSSDILEPVRLITRDSKISPKSIVLQPKVEYDENLENWNIAAIYMDNTLMWEKNGIGSPSNSIQWDFERERIVELARKDLVENYISAKLSVLDNEGNSDEASTAIPIFYENKSKYYDGEIVKDSIVERYNLIFFDYDKPLINEENKHTFKTILNRINTNSSLSITGFTDKLGTDDYNKQLSIDRANSVEKAIKERVVPEKIFSRGVGETLIYDNNLPEGRFYNRTVIVEIATPLKHRQ
ncbi:MAG: OmpA family protein [Candidatus Kapaibacterium sp.]|nr:OmpA family protein [Ignavibacteriota bacterium]MCB9221509.1 OmpA family protein [Ignavibacteria bacterium]MCB9222348.1 OmpA family protein [Ignavibacteria bacterium]